MNNTWYWQSSYDGFGSGTARLKNTTNDPLFDGNPTGAPIPPGETSRIPVLGAGLQETNPDPNHIPMQAQMLLEDGQVYNPATNRLLSFTAFE